MAVTFNCSCAERQKPVAQRNWRVVQRHCHRSAFGGGRRTHSDWSTVVCRSCRAIGRTKAAYVALLRDANDSEN